MKARSDQLDSFKFKRATLIIVLLTVVGIQLTACTPVEQTTEQYTIGLVTNNPNGLKNIQGFQDGMAELGYVAGENATYRFADAPVQGDELKAVLQEMVAADVDLIFTAGTPTGIAAYQVTRGTEIPVVFGVIADPLAAGVMTDLTQPGGNMTGVKLSSNQARRLELLLEIAPDVKQIYIPYNPDDAAPSSAIAQIYALAPMLGLEIIEGHAHNDEEVTQLLATIPEEIDAIFMLPDSTVNARVNDLVAIAIDRRLPTSGPSMVQVEAGVLTAYGILHDEAGKQAAHIADQVIKGVDPGTIPVESAEFYLGINLQTAEAIGLDIPYQTLQQAAVIVRRDE